jgi:thymidylate synthase
MNSIERQYLHILEDLLLTAPFVPDRTGVGTYEKFGTQIKADLQDGFPLLTTKKLNIQTIATELIWFLKGSTNIKYLQDNNVHIWDEWADEKGELGPVYGKQWRSWETEYDTFDQIKQVIESIRKNPQSRRHIVSAWKVDEIDQMKLPPCHLLFQFHVSHEPDDRVGKPMLSCHMYQRSADWFLGVPFNIASYALLTHIIAAECNLAVGTLTISFGSYHLYANHREAALTQLRRRGEMRELPSLEMQAKPWDKYEPTDFDVSGYFPMPFIKADIAV